MNKNNEVRKMKLHKFKGESTISEIEYLKDISKLDGIESFGDKRYYRTILLAGIILILFALVLFLYLSPDIRYLNRVLTK